MSILMLSVWHLSELRIALTRSLAFVIECSFLGHFVCIAESRKRRPMKSVFVFGYLKICYLLVYILVYETSVLKC